ncbi:MAG: ubiquinol-cytochrome c reductase iron-sulfur subunit, partial [Ktedonobacteraceae bacterium]
MSGEDQERFEDYLELEQYLEELQAGHIAHPPAEMTPTQARVYRMAALFRSASPEASEPRPEFAEALQTRLEQELQQPVVTPQLSGKQGKQKQPPRFSRRRALFAGGAAVAASLALGAGVDRIIGQSSNSGASTGTSTTKDTPLIAAGVPTIWHPVTTLAKLGNGAVPFNANAIVGYVIRDNSDSSVSNNGEIIAMSAACTHMGCIVNWEDTDRKFLCPCHGGTFTASGAIDTSTGSWGVRYLRPLPRLNTKVENDTIYVEVPAPTTTSTSSSAGG